jgi:carbamoyltransferase
LILLGISAFYHDSAAALIINGEIIAAAQEERFTRLKNDSSFPVNAIKFCLNYIGKGIEDITAVVFYEKPFLKLERIFDTHYNNIPKGLLPFIMSLEKGAKDKLFIKSLIRKELKDLGNAKSFDVRILFTEHHLSHSAFAFFTSGFNEAAIINLDAVGEWATTSIHYGSKNTIKKIVEQNFPDSLGLLYSSFTYFLGFKVNSGEYKLMGLAPYGDENSTRYKKFYELILNKLVTVYDDGSIKLNQKYFSFGSSLHMISKNKWEKIFNVKKRNPESEIIQDHCDLALAIQKVTEKIIIKLAYRAKELTGSKNLCLSGGVALNCVANGKVFDEKIFDKVYVPFAPGDSGSAIGAALAAHHIYFDKPVMASKKTSSPYLGPAFDEYEIETALKGQVHSYIKVEEDSRLFRAIATELGVGKVIGWFQGRSEFGPRALGNRSILADPRRADMHQRINSLVKFRENFRPFAPSILEEEAYRFFPDLNFSPYMQFVTDFNEELWLKNGDKEEKGDILKKLQIERTPYPAVTHVDYSARVQTVSNEMNSKFWHLLKEFHSLTGCPLLLNTSFNLRGEPIVNSPQEAVACFNKSGLDILVLNNFIAYKKDSRWNF